MIENTKKYVTIILIRAVGYMISLKFSLNIFSYFL